MATLYAYMSWRQVFTLFGAIGGAWAVVFWWRYREEPHAPRPVEGRVNWAKLMRSRSAWALGAQWFCHYYGFYFYITWLPQYLYQARGLDLRHGSLAAGLPLVSAGLGSLLAGWTLTKLARKLLGYAAYGGAAALLLLFTWSVTRCLRWQ